MRPQIESRLEAEARRALKDRRGLRRPKTEDIFRRIGYVVPRDLRIVNFHKRPVASFNPGALLVGRELWVFPRLIFDYYSYTSSVGFFKLNVEEVLAGEWEKPLETRVVLWPRMLWEFKGCEDPRAAAFGDEILLLYTGLGYARREDIDRRVSWVQGLARLDRSLAVKERRFMSIRSGEERVTPRMKDCAFIDVKGREATMLCRPTISGIEICWSGVADLENGSLSASSMRPVLVFEEWELKMGWSTNVVKLSKDEYIVGWHGVLAEDYSYREGLAVVNREGELLGVSDYLLAPRGVVEEYGDRPLVIFGCGLVKYKDQLIWVGGVADCGIGIFSTSVDEALERIRWVKG